MNLIIPNVVTDIFIHSITKRIQNSQLNEGVNINNLCLGLSFSGLSSPVPSSFIHLNHLSVADDISLRLGRPVIINRGKSTAIAIPESLLVSTLSSSSQQQQQPLLSSLFLLHKSDFLAQGTSTLRDLACIVFSSVSNNNNKPDQRIAASQFLLPLHSLSGEVFCEVLMSVKFSLIPDSLLPFFAQQHFENIASSKKSSGVDISSIRLDQSNTVPIDALTGSSSSLFNSQDEKNNNNNNNINNVDSIEMRKKRGLVDLKTGSAIPNTPLSFGTIGPIRVRTSIKTSGDYSQSSQEHHTIEQQQAGATSTAGNTVGVGDSLKGSSSRTSNVSIALDQDIRNEGAFGDLTRMDLDLLDSLLADLIRWRDLSQSNKGSGSASPGPVVATTPRKKTTSSSSSSSFSSSSIPQLTWPETLSSSMAALQNALLSSGVSESTAASLVKTVTYGHDSTNNHATGQTPSSHSHDSSSHGGGLLRASSTTLSKDFKPFEEDSRSRALLTALPRTMRILRASSSSNSNLTLENAVGTILNEMGKGSRFSSHHQGQLSSGSPNSTSRSGSSRWGLLLSAGTKPVIASDPPNAPLTHPMSPGFSSSSSSSPSVAAAPIPRKTPSSSSSLSSSPYAAAVTSQHRSSSHHSSTLKGSATYSPSSSRSGGGRMSMSSSSNFNDEMNGSNSTGVTAAVRARLAALEEERRFGKDSNPLSSRRSSAAKMEEAVAAASGELAWQQTRLNPPIIQSSSSSSSSSRINTNSLTTHDLESLRLGSSGYRASIQAEGTSLQPYAPPSQKSSPEKKNGGGEGEGGRPASRAGIVTGVAGVMPLMRAQVSKLTSPQKPDRQYQSSASFSSSSTPSSADTSFASAAALPPELVRNSGFSPSAFSSSTSTANATLKSVFSPPQANPGLRASIELPGTSSFLNPIEASVRIQKEKETTSSSSSSSPTQPSVFSSSSNDALSLTSDGSKLNITAFPTNVKQDATPSSPTLLLQVNHSRTLDNVDYHNNTHEEEDDDDDEEHVLQQQQRKPREPTAVDLARARLATLRSSNRDHDDSIELSSDSGASASFSGQSVSTSSVSLPATSPQAKYSFSQQQQQQQQRHFSNGGGRGGGGGGSGLLGALGEAEESSDYESSPGHSLSSESGNSLLLDNSTSPAPRVRQSNIVTNRTQLSVLQDEDVDIDNSAEDSAEQF